MTMVFSGIFQGKTQEVVINKQLLTRAWSAAWVTSPDAKQREYGIYHFRKTFQLSHQPATFWVHVTADNRYRLFVNGIPACAGPARGDLFNWFYESIDIAPYLKEGENIIAAQVWNMGDLAPVGQISNQTGFLLQGDTKEEQIADTDPSWKVVQNLAYQPCALDNMERLKAYMVVGPGDAVDGKLYPWNWEKAGFDDQLWKNARVICKPQPVGYGTDNLWTLAPRSIPLLDEKKQFFSAVRKDGGLKITQEFLQGKETLTIPANHKVSILLDQSYHMVAYPELVLSQGKGAEVKMTYAEALFDPAGNKGNRNETEGKRIKGNYDVFVPDGGEKRSFRPLWIRAYRYVQLDITTQDVPLVIEGLSGTQTGYPLQLKATFSSSDASLEDIWKAGWRTAQNCAGEAYYDTPYYEQLQYTGDSRIQALISLYTTGDDRLMRKSILDFYHSRTPEGLTQGRYPSNRLQIIPTFSLFWVSMVHDYWMHKRDEDFVKQFLPAIHEVMTWYENRIDQRIKMLGPLTWWNFIDWDNFNDWGTAPGAETGNSAIISLQYAYTLRQAADLFAHFEQEDMADRYRALAKKVCNHTYLQCYDEDKQLMADTPEKKSYSQHAGIWAILSGAVNAKEAGDMMKKMLEDKSMGQVTFFYRFYLTQAMKKAGMADRYEAELTPWREMLKMGLTTFAEKPEPTRSDCHAWSASPNYDFLATICGIMPAAPGFRKVLIRPAMGSLNEVRCTMPHPSGEIVVWLKKKPSGVLGVDITLPLPLSGELVWKDKTVRIHGGKQKFDL